MFCLSVILCAQSAQLPVSHSPRIAALYLWFPLVCLFVWQLGGLPPCCTCQSLSQTSCCPAGTHTHRHTHREHRQRETRRLSLKEWTCTRIENSWVLSTCWFSDFTLSKMKSILQIQFCYSVWNMYPQLSSQWPNTTVCWLQLSWPASTWLNKERIVELLLEFSWLSWKSSQQILSLTHLHFYRLEMKLLPDSTPCMGNDFCPSTMPYDTVGSQIQYVWGPCSDCLCHQWWLLTVTTAYFLFCLAKKLFKSSINQKSVGREQEKGTSLGL